MNIRQIILARLDVLGMSRYELVEKRLGRRAGETTEEYRSRPNRRGKVYHWLRGHSQAIRSETLGEIMEVLGLVIAPAEKADRRKRGDKGKAKR